MLIVYVKTPLPLLIGSIKVYTEEADINPLAAHIFVRYLACQHIEVRAGGISSSQLRSQCVVLSNS